MDGLDQNSLAVVVLYIWESAKTSISEMGTWWYEKSNVTSSSNIWIIVYCQDLISPDHDAGYWSHYHNFKTQALIKQCLNSLFELYFHLYEEEKIIIQIHVTSNKYIITWWCWARQYSWLFSFIFRQWFSLCFSHPNLLDIGTSAILISTHKVTYQKL